jgi:hypothetical protein
VLLEGIDLSRGRRRKRYSLPGATTGSRATQSKNNLGRGIVLGLTITDRQYMSIGVMDLNQVERRIARLQKQLRELGPLHPGSITVQCVWPAGLSLQGPEEASEAWAVLLKSVVTNS